MDNLRACTWQGSGSAKAPGIGDLERMFDNDVRKFACGL
jgi:hypothetical protein